MVTDAFAAGPQATRSGDTSFYIITLLILLLIIFVVVSIVRAIVGRRRF